MNVEIEMDDINPPEVEVEIELDAEIGVKIENDPTSTKIQHNKESDNLKKF